MKGCLRQIAPMVLGILVIACDLSTKGPGTGPLPQPSTKWSVGANVPIPVLEHGAAAYRGKIYIAGGFHIIASQLTDSVFAYDPATDVWSTLAQLPADRSLMRLVVVGDSLYAIGGVSNAITSTAESNNWVYMPDEDRWEARAPIPVGWAGGGAVAANGEIFLVGGFGVANILQAAVMIYNPPNDTWRLGSNIPTLRSRLGVGVIGGSIYAAAGRTANPGTEFPTLEIYDIATDTWTTGSPMQRARAGVGAAVLSGRLHIFGGLQLQTFFALHDSFDASSGQWASEDGMPTFRFELGAVELNGLIYTIGGVALDGQNTQLEIYDPNG